MRRIISFALSLIILLSCVTVNCTAYADAKPTVEAGLKILETQQGYIPGKTSAVTYNCFGFISKICEKLYGVSYAYEQQNGNYKFNHTSNYYTVSESVYPYSADAAVRRRHAQSIKDWILANAAVGDIMQYGCADSSYSKKHTVLIQHLDADMMQVIHANYATKDVPASVCRIDTIYWNSFVSNPDANELNPDGTIKSLNLLFGSGLKLTKGFGISLNRYSFLENTYALQSLSATNCSIKKAERKSTTSIKITWNEISGATAYGLEYRKIDSGVWLSASDLITDKSYTVKNLTPGKTYSFRVRAFVNEAWCEYSTEYIKSCQPPKPAKITATGNESGITLTWASRSDITGCIIYRSLYENEGYEAIADISNNNVSTFTDTSVTVNTCYYYKIQRYIITNGGVVSGEPSSAFKASIGLAAPQNIKASVASKSSVKLSWTPAENAQSYLVGYVVRGGSEVKYINTDKPSCTIKKLSCGKTYYFYVASCNQFGLSADSNFVSFKVKPKKVSVKVSSKASKAKLTWKKAENVSGYIVYRSYSKNGRYSVVKTIKGNKKNPSFRDKNTYKGNRYYYKVKSYVTRGGKRYLSVASAVKSVKIK